jgi:FKBP-type peptidyl-prolyl cis-trans isomerase
MKFSCGYFLLPIMLLPGVVRAQDAPKDDKEKVSYSIGVDIGKNLKRAEIDINSDMLTRGLHDALGDGKTAMTDQEMQQTMQNFQTDMQSKMQKKRTEMAEKNKTEGEAFLAENKKKSGIKTLPSGLQYEVVTEGKGEKPKASDTVKTNYRGTLIDGKEFDSSFKRNEPAIFPVGGVIPGWTEALQLMPVGSKWKLYVPASLAYKENGPPGIGPNATLLFEIELLGIEKPAASPSPAAMVAPKTEVTIEPVSAPPPDASPSAAKKKKK